VGEEKRGNSRKISIDESSSIGKSPPSRVREEPWKSKGPRKPSEKYHGFKGLAILGSHLLHV